MKQVLYVGDRADPEHFHALGYEERNFAPDKVQHLGYVSLGYLRYLHEGVGAVEGPLLVNADGFALYFDEDGKVTARSSSDIEDVYGWDSPTGELAKVVGADDHALSYAVVWGQDGLPGLMRPCEQAFLGIRDEDDNFVHLVTSLYED